MARLRTWAGCFALAAAIVICERMKALALHRPDSTDELWLLTVLLFAVVLVGLT